VTRLQLESGFQFSLPSHFSRPSADALHSIAAIGRARSVRDYAR
jgi:hypothetical protein